MTLPLLSILALLSCGAYFSILGARLRHYAYLELRAQQDFEWRTYYYRACHHWRWQKDWESIAP